MLIVVRRSDAWSACSLGFKPILSRRAERIPGRGHRLSLAAIGASTSGRRPAEDEAMLAEGFGR
jgi:hypothetical protein